MSGALGTSGPGLGTPSEVRGQRSEVSPLALLSPKLWAFLWYQPQSISITENRACSHSRPLSPGLQLSGCSPSRFSGTSPWGSLSGLTCVPVPLVVVAGGLCFSDSPAGSHSLSWKSSPEPGGRRGRSRAPVRRVLLQTVLSGGSGQRAGRAPWPRPAGWHFAMASLPASGSSRVGDLGACGLQGPGQAPTCHSGGIHCRMSAELSGLGIWGRCPVGIPPLAQRVGPAASELPSCSAGCVVLPEAYVCVQGAAGVAPGRMAVAKGQSPEAA